MNIMSVIKAVNDAHKPQHKADNMVYQVWEDGEITLQKGGSLWNQRTLHTIAFGLPHKKIPTATMPCLNGDASHGYVIVGSNDEAEAVRSLIASIEVTK